MRATTAAGVILTILKEQHADCIVLGDSTRIPLAVGLTLEPFPSGSSVTVIYSRDSDGNMAVRDMHYTELARVPDRALR